MTERDEWSERLRCPSCGATGRVALSQANPHSDAYHGGRDQNVRVETGHGKFRAVVTDMGSQFYCVGCGTLAEHLA
jgi:hypothetical protein